MLVREKAWLGLVFLKTGRIFIRKQRFIINPVAFHLVPTGSLLPAPGCRNAWIKSITVHICCLENKVVSLTVGGISAAAVLCPSSLCIPPTPHFPDTRHPLPSTSRHQMAPSLCLSPPDHWGPSLCLQEVPKPSLCLAGPAIPLPLRAISYSSRLSYSSCWVFASFSHFFLLSTHLSFLHSEEGWPARMSAPPPQEAQFWAWPLPPSDPCH